MRRHSRHLSSSLAERTIANRPAARLAEWPGCDQAVVLMLLPRMLFKAVDVDDPLLVDDVLNPASVATLWPW